MISVDEAKALLKTAQEAERDAPIDFEAECLKRYGFYHPRFDFHVSRKTVTIKVNLVSLSAVLAILISKGQIRPIRYSVGDRLVYYGDRKLQPLDVLNIRKSLIEALKGEKLTHREVEEACLSFGAENKFDRLVDYFTSLPATDTHYIDTWLTDIFGVTDNELNRVIGKKFLVSAVARALHPGCYVEGALIFSGGQGAFKSYTCMELAPIPDTHFDDQIDITNTQKTAQTVQGKFLIEFAELSSLTPKTIEDIKNWLTRKEDTYVEKYSNVPTNVLRQFVCMGSTNSPTPLNDASGNRRFWVVRAGSKADIMLLRAIKHQLWAEALQLFREWSTPEYRASIAPLDPWVLTTSERTMLDESNKDFEMPSSVADWLMQNFHTFEHSEGFVSFALIKAAVKKFDNISDGRLSNILSLELKCNKKRRTDGTYYHYPFAKYPVPTLNLAELNTYRSAADVPN